MMTKYVYAVRSKLNEDLVYSEFETADDAINYAKENADQQTSVEKVEVDVNDFGEVMDHGDPEVIYISADDTIDDVDFDDFADDYEEDDLDDISIPNVAYEQVPVEVEDELDRDYGELLKSQEEAEAEAEHRQRAKAALDRINQKRAAKAKAYADSILTWDHPEDDVPEEEPVEVDYDRGFSTAYDNVDWDIEPVNPKKLDFSFDTDFTDFGNDEEEAIPEIDAAELSPLLEDTDEETVQDRLSRLENYFSEEVPGFEPVSEDVCKVNKAINHAEDEVKELKEGCAPCEQKVKDILTPLINKDKTDLRAVGKNDTLPKGFKFKSATRGRGTVSLNGKDFAYALVNGELRVMSEEDAGWNWSETILKESLLHEGVSAEAVAVVSELLEDEWEAISGYEDAAAKIEKLDVEDKEKVLHVLDHISEEESIHVGQLEQVVKLLNPEHINKQEEGHTEGEKELAGEDVHAEEPEDDTEVEEEPVDDEEVEESLDYDKLREELEENEDEVECQRCFNLVNKEDCVKGEHGYICKECLKQESLTEEVVPLHVGDKIEIINMEGEPNYTGRQGEVSFIDDMGQVHGTWGGLAVIPGQDTFRLISSDAEEVVEDLKEDVEGVNKGLLTITDRNPLVGYDLDISAEGMEADVHDEDGYEATVDYWDWSHTLTAEDVKYWFDYFEDEPYTQEQVDNLSEEEVDKILDKMQNSEDFCSDLGSNHGDEAENAISRNEEEGTLSRDYNWHKSDDPDYAPEE